MYWYQLQIKWEIKKIKVCTAPIAVARVQS
jgi:hypothetical protein